MRLIKYTIVFVFLLVFFVSSRQIVLANCCSGQCGGSDSCVQTNSVTQANSMFGGCSGSWVFDCTSGSAPVWTPGTSQGAYWSPGGSPNTVCSHRCTGVGAANSAVITETHTISCGPCGPTPTPISGGGGGGGGGGENPAQPTVAPTPVPISGKIQTDLSAAVSGSFCSQATDSPLSVTGLSLIADNELLSFQPTYTGGTANYSINTSFPGNSFTVTLDLSTQTGATRYVCSCPAAVDPNNPYLCRYTGVTSPGSDVNFYLKEYNLSNESWFQIFGGNYFGKNGVSAAVPYSFCAEDSKCVAALSAPQVDSDSSYSSGFPISDVNDSSFIVSSPASSTYHSYFHLPSRPENANSYDVSTDLGQLSYDYFYKLTENTVQQVGNGEDLEPLLSDWTGSAWWSSNDVNYVKVDGNVSIDETQGFNLTSDQKLVVFVDGNLTIDDSNTNDSNRKITSVAQGGFLAFFVSGNIIVTANVGYELNPAIPSVPLVSIANSNVEGVFVADEDLVIQSKTAIGEVPPDRKFIGSGTFVGWHDVLLNRTFDDNGFGPILNNNQAIENFAYRPDLLVNWPTKLKASVSNWREVDPQLINQQ